MFSKETTSMSKTDHKNRIRSMVCCKQPEVGGSNSRMGGRRVVGVGVGVNQNEVLSINLFFTTIVLLHYRLQSVISKHSCGISLSGCLFWKKWVWDLRVMRHLDLDVHCKWYANRTQSILGTYISAGKGRAFNVLGGVRDLCLKIFNRLATNYILF